MNFKYVIELLGHRVVGRRAADVVYVEDDLYYAYDEGLSRDNRYEAMEHPKPNLMFKGWVISPESIKPVSSCCCCCCKGCLK